MEELFNVLSGWVLWLWSQWQTQVLVGHIAANVVVAVAVSIATKTFILAKTGEFLYRKVLPLVLVYAVFAFVGESLQLVWVATAAWLMLETALLGDLLDNLKKLGVTNGGPRILSAIPSSLTKERGG